MVERQGAGTARKTEAMDSEASKETLQQQMDEARETIAQTVTDIKDTVVDKYNSVKETITDTLDWREQFRSHPVAWCVGALSVGYVIGNSLAAALSGTKHRDQLLSQLAAIGDKFGEELTKRGMSILTPVLTGTVLVPILASKVKELTGIDLTDLPSMLLNQDTNDGQARGKGKRKKKPAAKKQGRRKSLKS